MQNWKEILIGMLYPRRCPICHEIVAERGALICAACEKKILPIGEPRCKKCGKPLESMEQEYCLDCQNREHGFYEGIALYPYDKLLKKSIYQIKYHNKREYLDFYSHKMGEVLGKKIESWQIDLILPVPLHKKKKRLRGFNQAELLARGLGRALSLPVRPGMVIRVRATAPQKELDKRQRKENLKSAFWLRETGIKGKHILVVDDIYTTGATVDEIAGLLLEAGAERVYFAALCIGRG